jgi:2-hydroxy-3-keto-5-methylthiopentenyl-1-phosphate phosphatase
MNVEFAHVTATLDEADELLRLGVVFDPAFAAFVEACEANDSALLVISSGAGALIERALLRNGVGRVPFVAGTVEPLPTGWRLHFPGDAANGIDKAAHVLRARDEGFTTVYVGDGISDYEAATVADLRFAKRGKNLERFLASEALDFTAFASFTEVREALFG